MKSSLSLFVLSFGLLFSAQATSSQQPSSSKDSSVNTFNSSSTRRTDYSILDYGAANDTSILSTSAIQQAIDDCNQNGGGRVTIPAGNFKTGTIILKDNVQLYLEQGATLYGSRDLHDYIPLKPQYASLRTQENTVQLIYAENISHAGIGGQGCIDGQGRGFHKQSWNDEGITRPHLIRFICCQSITVEGITLKNSPCWMQHYLACDELQIRGLRIWNRNNFNNDALDLDGCHNVCVSDLISDTDDDGITLKSTSPRRCENISISNCVISSRCNAIKLGTETNGGFRNINISNCVVKPSSIGEPYFYGRVGGTSGISLEITDGGIMSGVHISNILIDGTESPIFIRLANRARPYQKDIPVENVGQIKNISLNHIQIINPGKTGCSITGIPNHPVENIHLSNISIEYPGGGSSNDAHRIVDEKEKDYPEATMFGILPAYGFYIRHARHIVMSQLDLRTLSSDARPAFYTDDVQDFILKQSIYQVSSGITPLKTIKTSGLKAEGNIVLTE